MRRSLLSLLALCGLCLPLAAAASPYDWRAYPNGSQAIRVAVSDTWLLLEAPAVPSEALAKALAEVAPGARLTRTERLTRDRVAVEITGADGKALEAVGQRLVRAGAVARTWPAWTREAGVGFFDNQLVIAFRGAVDRAAAAAAGAKLVGPTRLPGVWTAVADDGDALRAAWALTHQPTIRWAEPDLIRHVAPLDLPDDPSVGEQWHLPSGDLAGSIDAEGAWAVTAGERQVVMGIFDTGYDMDHPDLVANIVGGFDAAGGDDDPEAGCGDSPDGAGRAGSCPANAPYRESHGTAVAGVVAAVANNGVGGTGVCPGCTLFPVRLLGSSGLRSISNANAFQRAADEGVWAINNSWGPSLTRFFPLARAENEVFDRITTEGRDGKGVVLVFAAGNDYFTPATANPYAAHPGVITVSASTRTDDFACYSNYGSVIAVAGPSQGCFNGESGIATADYVGGEGYSPTDFTNSFGGTSAASPVVAGVVGLILSANPDLTAQQVRLVLQQTAEKIVANKNPWEAQFGVNLEQEFAYDEHGFSQGFGYGRVNAARAVALALEGFPQTGGACDDLCPNCVAGRCSPPCDTDADCGGAARCLALDDAGNTGCAIPSPDIGDIGQPCAAGCETCVDTLNSNLDLTRICTASCANDDECPFGFDCRQLLAGDASVCIPGNAECGAVWGSVRCQSEVVVTGGSVEYCSCDCLPDTLGACPEGFVCSQVTCEGTRGGIACEPTDGRGNYLPVCVPDPNYQQPCTTTEECPGGTWCINRVCQADRAPEGCDACAPCTEDADCAEGSACVDMTRGKRCAPHCEGTADESCPGDSVCVEIPGPAGYHCVNPDFRRKGFCPRAYRCEVDGRCFSDSDCEEGRCEDNLCPGASLPDMAMAPDQAVPDMVPEEADAGVADAASPDAEAETPRARKDSGCSTAPSTPGSGGLLLLALGVIGLVRRRR
ncbi:MAG: S8 family serine peptidase [Myxococcales bacterium]|nr:S8 family serine peptidase [Myxococcales bacterium]